MLFQAPALTVQQYVPLPLKLFSAKALALLSQMLPKLQVLALINNHRKLMGLNTL
jgi:hypothetical protein